MNILKNVLSYTANNDQPKYKHFQANEKFSTTRTNRYKDEDLFNSIYYTRENLTKWQMISFPLLADSDNCHSIITLINDSFIISFY